ncbi:MAG: hypothetical protein A2007_05975 [Verrucomicrobia bacterium GWC2_42_7]|nr:MAG: hypothetical protein A2007_05975 [Verrucomicrobia bacterium GWC2_42_7]
MYGRIDFGNVSARERIKKPFPYKPLTIPMVGTQTQSPLEDCNLSLTVVVNPQRGLSSTNKIEEIVDEPQWVDEESPVALTGGGRKLKGIRPPDHIQITVVKKLKNGKWHYKGHVDVFNDIQVD